MKLQVRIVSLFAMCDPERDTFTWSGEVELARRYDDAPDAEICEALYRYFNRVVDEDGPHLEAIGYRLPSLSAADTIAFRRLEPEAQRMEVYDVASVGFQSVLPGLGRRS